MKAASLALCLSAIITSASSADYVDYFEDFWMAGAMTASFAPGSITGESIVGITLEVTRDDVDSVASDFAVYIATDPLQPGGLFQLGGWHSLGALDWQTTTGNDWLIAGVEFATPISLDGTGLGVWIGCTGGEGQAYWGSVTLHTVAVPAPGAIALLGLAGLVGRRRRA